MIPKTIHYIWVGSRTIPAKYQSFINEWSRKMPDWEIIRWDESNFDIEHSADYCREAYALKKWAFVSDYIRVKVLYDHGGIYLDADEEMIRSLDRFVEHSVFFGLEPGLRLQAGVFGCEPQNRLIGTILAQYDQMHYVVDRRPDNTVIGIHFQNILQEVYPQFVPTESAPTILDGGVAIYPSRYFCPDLATLKITDESYTVHRPMGSWLPPNSRKNCILSSPKSDC